MQRYCESIFQTKRWKTREVMVGNIGIGGDNPVRVQSMTTSNTRDVEATAEQVMRLADHGCEIARVTVQGMKEADACEAIKDLLVKKGYSIPLVADIHFFPPAATRVIEFVDKVRVNPGNFVDKRAQFKSIEYDDASYARELEKIEAKFGPLVEKCKKLGKAMRIGTNHGSLSDRIMNRYGDTPAGMVESALEFARVARKYDYHDMIFSMKASNPIVMVHAYRLLVHEMMQLGWNYPLHLGVTEAGEGEDGRIKSAMGIGTLLLDGLGDTIRVSLTEDPWLEVDPCQRLKAFAASQQGCGIAPFDETFRNFNALEKRSVQLNPSAPLHRDGTVGVGVQEIERAPKKADFVQLLGESYDQSAVNHLIDGGIGVISQGPIPRAIPLRDLSSSPSLIEGRAEQFALSLGGKLPKAVFVGDESPEMWENLKQIDPSMILFGPSQNRLHRGRQFFEWLVTNQLDVPVILNFEYSCSAEDLVIQASAECGALLIDGFGDGVCLRGEYSPDDLCRLGFNILQAARMRSTKTEFISCPSCGRTLFDLQDVSAQIRERTGHLPGVKIGIMGCIVNGPGEMADSDFGYVGSKADMIDLYVGKECVERNIHHTEAVDRLVDLIKRHGRWVEPKKEPAEKQAL